ncbi:MAG: hypothetical protein UT50_C0003G0014 [Candidatus Moranbacteria bacterium GW2011_GWA2_39_41]|nr:MAG: hypothetical protein UT50_C0003G0014 [Candidatus Moranbacteria bacterium GW2011_GWA2_39_41]
MISSAIILSCLLLTIYFPAQGNLQTFSSVLFFLFLLPVLYIKLILKQNLANFGFNLRNKSIGLLWACLMLFVSLLIAFFLIHFYNFEQKYIIPAYIAQNFGSFLFYELILVNFLLFIQEFFFKGFLLSFLSQRFGLWSVLLQSLLFILFLIITRELDWQVAPLIILTLTGGVVAYKSKSFLYSYAMGIFFLIIIDAYIIHLFK